MFGLLQEQTILMDEVIILAISQILFEAETTEQISKEFSFRSVNYSIPLVSHGLIQGQSPVTGNSSSKQVDTASHSSRPELEFPATFD